MQTTMFSVPDIVCEGCASAIKKALGTLPGAADVTVDVAAKTVTVTHGTNLNRATVEAALDRAGFPVAV